MDCFYCRSYNRKFYCSRCLTDKLADHYDELNSMTSESKQAIQQAEAFLEKASKVHALVVEKKQRSSNVKRLMDDQKRTLQDSDIVKHKVERLRKDMEQRRKNMEQGRRSLQRAQQALDHPPDDGEKTGSDKTTMATTNVQKSWLRTYKMTARTRQILVKEAASLFDLKLGVVEDGDDEAIHGPTTDTHHLEKDKGQQTLMDEETNNGCDSLQNSTMAFTRSSRTYGKLPAYEDLYICGVSLPARLIDVSRYPKEELNSAIGYTSQMLDLIVRYLGIKMPFCLFRKDIYTYIRSIPHSRLYQSQSKMPLFLEDDKNFRRFLVGVSMLNYNIVYLCFTQGVQIPLSQAANTLQNLMACCNAPGLGLRSHAMIYQGLNNLDFTFDFNQILRQTALRYRCGSRSATIRGQQGTDDSKQERTEKYFKVRRSAFLGDQYDDKEDEDDPFDLTDDDDDDIDIDEDDSQQYHHRRHHQPDNQDETTSSSNENWNLVDVMPAFATQSGQNDSIFHLGAAHLGATIMPGVLGMMENLGGGRHAYSSGVNDNEESISNYPRTPLHRR